MRKLTCLQVIFVVLIFSAAFVSSAQEDVPTPVLGDGWSLEKRCLTEPTLPPENWKFDGTLLYRHRFGIGGLNADWETTRVLVFTNVARPGHDLFSGSLSPNLRWLAVAEGDRQCATPSCQSVQTDVVALHLFDLMSDNPRAAHYTLEWDFWYISDRSFYDAPAITWIDNEHFLYPLSSAQNQVVNPFTGEISTWNGFANLERHLWLSPDLSRSFESGYDESDYYLRLYNVETDQEIAIFSPREFELLETRDMWAPNSSKFVTQFWTGRRFYQLRIYDRDGNYIDNIMNIPTYAGLYGEPYIEWSPDSRFLAIRWAQTASETYFLDNYTVYIVDLQEKRIRDLCLSDSIYFTWSPDSKYLALQISEGDLTILDREGQNWYALQRLNIYPFAWRAE